MKKTDQRKVLQNGHDTVLINQHFVDLNPLFIGSENCKPGKSFGPTVRNYTLIHYVVQGEGKLFKNGEVYSVHAGEAFLILPDEIVTYRADEKNPWHYQWVGFDGTLTERFRDLAPVIRFPSGLIREMIEVLEKDLPEYRIAALLFQMYAILFEGKKVHNHYVRQVQDHIHALYMQPIRVEEIAAQLNLDRRYLSRLFKERTGETIQEYLISVRMEEAQRRLEQGLSVEESAKLCGYEDPSNFSKMFKRRFGVCPLHWKRESN